MPTSGSELRRRVLIVDDELGRPATAGGRAVCALAAELRARGVEVLEALSIEDGLATVASDSGIHCVLPELDHRAERKALPRSSHRVASRPQRSQRESAHLLMADRKLAGSVTVEVATLADEFVWLLDDTAVFIAGRVLAAIERYLEAPPAAFRRRAGALQPRP